MDLPALCLVLLLSPTADPPRPAWVVEAADTKRVEAALRYTCRADRLRASEWVGYVARAPELPGQSRVNTTVRPAGTNATDLSDLKCPLIRLRVPGKGGERLTTLSVVVGYEATLRSRHLVPLPPGAAPPKVEPLPDRERTQWLAPRETIDFQAPGFQAWLKESGLQRGKDEGELDFARRAFLHVGNKSAYEYREEMDRHASAVCRGKKSDCGGLSNLFVAILRASRVPARTLVGRWATSASGDERLGGLPYYQIHVKAEFYAAGVGWVPVDLSSAVLHDPTPERLQFFGHDDGKFLTFHLDPDLLLDSVYFGKKRVHFLQTPMFWAAGAGSFDGATTSHTWEVRTVK